MCSERTLVSQALAHVLTHIPAEHNDVPGDAGIFNLLAIHKILSLFHDVSELKRNMVEGYKKWLERQEVRIENMARNGIAHVRFVSHLLSLCGCQF